MPEKLKILVVDDEKSQRDLVSGFLEKNCYQVTVAESGEDALEKYQESYLSVVLVDMKMPGMNGIELIEKLKELNPFVQVIMLTAFGSVDTAVAAMKKGAFDYLTKPIEDLDELLLKINKARDQNRLVVENTLLRERLEEFFPSSEIIGNSKSINEIKKLISLVAKEDTTVLITGPSGTGKELVARAIHSLSGRAERNLVAINCAAFPENLLESELFGFEKGAFTGADKTKMGRFELADGGTLFLDEIGEMPLSMQVKLLRVLEDKKIQRLGAVKEISLDIRIIAASNKNLEEASKNKEFREDLFYRLNVVNIIMPSLKERGADIILLAETFLKKLAKKMGKDIKGFDKEAAKIIRKYDWPGNVRELQNVIERAVVLTQTNAITSDELRGISSKSIKPDKISTDLTLAEMEKAHITASLKVNNFSISLTAEALGIHRNTLSSKIKEYQINLEK